MYNQKEIFNRIKMVMGFKQEKELANFLEMSPQSLGTVKKRGTIPWEKIIEKSSENYSLDYIFLGIGNVNTKEGYILERTLDNTKVKEVFSLIENYASPKILDDLEEKLLKLKEFQEQL